MKAASPTALIIPFPSQARPKQEAISEMSLALRLAMLMMDDELYARFRADLAVLIPSTERKSPGCGPGTALVFADAS